LEQWEKEKSLMDVPIRAIGTMEERKKPNGCSNKSHWNNGREKKA
jgi:hypothetical protein